MKTETTRLQIRSWSPDDLESAVTLWTDPLVTDLIDSRKKLSETEAIKIFEQNACAIPFL